MKKKDQLALIQLKYLTNNQVTVIGKSMYPCLQEGDQVYLDKHPRYQVGDIIVFSYEGGILIHRIVARYNGSLLCKGDNAFAIEKIFMSQVYGKVVTIKRNGTTVSLLSMSKEFYKLSIAINKIYCASNYDIEKTKSSTSYKLFFMKYLNWE